MAEELRAPDDAAWQEILRYLGQMMQKSGPATKLAPDSPYLEPDRPGLADMLGIPGAGRILEKIADKRRVLPTMTQPADPDLLDAAGLAALGAKPAAGLARGVAREAANYTPKVGAAAQIGAIQSWHGSPADNIVKFLRSKSGSGQGAATFGEGHYTAEGYPTAHSYWDLLNPETMVAPGGKKLNPPPNSRNYDATVEQEAFNEARNLAWFHKRLGTERPLGEAFKDARNQYDEIAHRARSDMDPFTRASAEQREQTMAKVLDYLHDWGRKGVEPQKGGAIYHVQQAWPDPTREMVDPLSRSHYLDLDRPYGNQSDSVLLGLEQAFNRMGQAPKGLKDKTGMDIYDAIKNVLGGQGKLASQLLHESGIPGNAYLDQGSRAVGKGTSNYVTFDDDTLSILHKILGKDVRDPF